jgi:hypothetical protein
LNSNIDNQYAESALLSNNNIEKRYVSYRCPANLRVRRVNTPLTVDPMLRCTYMPDQPDASSKAHLSRGCVSGRKPGLP